MNKSTSFQIYLGGRNGQEIIERHTWQVDDPTHVARAFELALTSQSFGVGLTRDLQLGAATEFLKSTKAFHAFEKSKKWSDFTENFRIHSITMGFGRLVEQFDVPRPDTIDRARKAYRVYDDLARRVADVPLPVTTAQLETIAQYAGSRWPEIVRALAARGPMRMVTVANIVAVAASIGIPKRRVTPTVPDSEGPEQRLCSSLRAAMDLISTGDKTDAEIALEYLRSVAGRNALAQAVGRREGALPGTSSGATIPVDGHAAPPIIPTPPLVDSTCKPVVVLTTEVVASAPSASSLSPNAKNDDIPSVGAAAMISNEKDFPRADDTVASVDGVANGMIPLAAPTGLTQAGPPVVEAAGVPCKFAASGESGGETSIPPRKPLPPYRPFPHPKPTNSTQIAFAVVHLDELRRAFELS